MPERAVVAWSGGKDSFLALGRALADPDLRVVGLLTTVVEGTDRVAMHGVRLELVAAQARMLGLPLHAVALPAAGTDEAYDARMGAALAEARAAGVTRVVHGDLFRADVRAYRDERLARAGMAGVYPLWGEPTEAVARRFLAGGHEAVVVCVDGQVLGASFAGRAYDAAFLADLPPGADPAGENGEFHTFVHASPAFRAPVPFRLGARSSDGRFHRVDLLPGAASSEPPRNADLSGVPVFGAWGHEPEGHPPTG